MKTLEVSLQVVDQDERLVTDRADVGLPRVLLVEGGDVVRQVALGREHFVAEVAFHLCAAVGDSLVLGEALHLDELLVTDEANELQLLKVRLLLVAIKVVLLVKGFGAVVALPILALANCLVGI
jgi:hypothetical protein